MGTTLKSIKYFYPKFTNIQKRRSGRNPPPSSSKKARVEPSSTPSSNNPSSTPSSTQII